MKPNASPPAPVGDPILDQAAQRLLQHARRLRIKRILLGVSGGPDSVFLLLAAHAVRAEFDTIHVAHVNHDLRLQASDKDQAFVEKLAIRHKFPVHSKRIAVRDEDADTHQGVETRARAARYKYFHDIVREFGLDAVVVAHTLNDQIETILLNFIRGAGPGGLAGMEDVTKLRFADFKQDLTVVRPLLDIPKENLLAYLDKYAITYCQDATNDDTEFTRNKIRHEIIPKLLEINPNLFEAVSQTSVLLKEDDAERKSRIDQLLAAEDLFRRKSRLEYYLRQDRFLQFSTSTKRLLIMSLLKNLVGRNKEVTYDHIQNALEFLDSGNTGDEIHLPDNVRIEKAVGTFILRRLTDGKEAPPPPTPTSLPLPGQVAFGADRVTAELLAPLKSVRLKKKLLSGDLTPDPNEAYLDADALPAALTVRSWESGDRIVPFGMRKSKKVQDVFVDGKIPRRRRPRIPLVTDGREVVWIAGALFHDAYKVTDDTKRLIKLTYHPDASDGED
jgi:tRNA(Ile)-lysidine synthase